MKKSDRGKAIYCVEVFGKENLTKLRKHPDKPMPHVFVAKTDNEIMLCKFGWRDFLCITNDEFTSISANWDGVPFSHFPFLQKSIIDNRRQRVWNKSFKECLRFYKLEYHPELGPDDLAAQEDCHGPDWYYFPSGGPV